MLRHYLRSAWRTIRRNPFYSLINIGCLAIGIAVTMTILLYLLHEHSFDRWHANASRIFTVYTTQTLGESRFRNGQLSCITGPAAKQADPSVETFVRTFPFPEQEGVELQNPADPASRYWESRDFLFADSNFFQVFSFRLLRGHPESVLARPFTVVLTQVAAKKYFGASDPVGKTIVFDGKYRLEVTGIARDVPSNSSFSFGLIASMSTLARIPQYKVYLDDQRLRMGNFKTWLLLKDAADTARVERNLRRIALEADARAPKDVPDAFTETHDFYLQPIADLHLIGAFGVANGLYLGPFTWVAAVILLLALVNYMGLATARAAGRAREVGVRKVLGAGRAKIAGQYYTESAMIGAISFLAGGLLFLIFRPYFFNLLQLPIDGRFLVSPVVLCFFSALLALIIFVAGSYPSLVLSRFRPVAVLYGKVSRQRGGERVRKGFIVLQFAISMTLVICSVVIGKELSYIRHKDTGIDRTNVVMLPFGETMQHYPAYKREVAGLPPVQEVATTHYELYTGGLIVHLVHLPGRPKPEQLLSLVADTSLVPMLGLKWMQAPAAGSGWYGKDHVALNEAAVANFGLGEAVGRQLRIDDSLVTVAGVLRDFNYLSLRGAIEPFGISVVNDADREWPAGLPGCLYVKIRPNSNLPGVMDDIRKVYSKYDHRSPFSFEFLDDAFDSNYKEEDRLVRLFGLFTFVTIVIACLGLFALATFSAEQRVKEIGIRKVLGASVASIGALLSKDFLRPVLLAVMIACPASWWIMSRWLQDFAYRTSLSWWLFATAGFGLVGVALVTVLTRSLRAGRANPIDNLRTE
jgi:putative ABC transport system permease protein